MGPELTLILAIALGLYMAFGIGANDVANAIGTSVGSKALTVKKAIIMAAILEFLGAFLPPPRLQLGPKWCPKSPA